MPEKSPSVASSATVSEQRPYQRFIEHLAMLADVNEGADDGDAIAADIMDRMLTADSLEEAIDVQNQGLPSGKDFVDVEQLVRSIEVRRGDEEYADHSLGYYLKVDAVKLETGEEITYACGARNVVVILVQAMHADRLPMECVLRSRRTKQGALLTLQFLPKRAVKVSA
jgi:hypothetical protein